MAKGKRGRPKKDPVYRDKGTPELQIKRMFIVKGGDPVNSSDPLDVCQERGIITSDMAKAGHDYARLYYRIIGKPFNSINYDKLLNRSEGFTRITSSPSRGESYAEWLLTECFKVLRDCKCKVIVDEVSLLKEYPHFLYKDKPDILDNNYKEKLRQGLKNLDQWFCKSNRKYRKKK
jgi:hypothetical protein|tara:strand:- start:46 stop:573 length:528 start_codon:yes stop_codon:yes gene_type:complete